MTSFVWNPPRAEDMTSPAERFVYLACLIYGEWHRGNPQKAEQLLAEHPALATADISCAAAAGNAAHVAAWLESNPALLDVPGGALGWPPLLYACYSRLEDRTGRSTLEVARLLLARGADPDAGFLWDGTYAFTALTGAFGRGEDWINQLPHPHADVLARLLLDAGADPNDGQTLYNRHFQPDDAHLTLLLEYGLGKAPTGPWIARVGDKGYSPERMLVEEVWGAAKHGFGDRIRLLAAHGADLNTPGIRNKRTPYEEALRAGHPDAAELLVSLGARRVELDELESFALECITGRADAVRARLALDPTLVDRLGYHGRVEMLHRAVEARQYDGVRLIAGLGVDLNAMVPGTGLDRAALHQAALMGDLAMVRLLVELGADTTLKDCTYNSPPLGWANYADKAEVAEFLRHL
jgi:ankyrin repeat protein